MSSNTQKMKIQIETSAKSIEMANFFLARATEAARETPKFRKVYSISESDIKAAEAFRKSLVKAFTKK